MFILDSQKEQNLTRRKNKESSKAVSQDKIYAELIPVNQESSACTTANEVLSKKYSQHQNNQTLHCNARGAIIAKETPIRSWEFSQNELHFPLSTI